MLKSPPTFGVVIPIAPDETHGVELLRVLSASNYVDEVVLSGPTSPAWIRNLLAKQSKVRWTKTPKGRAEQLNGGADACKTTFICFLHADCILSKQAVKNMALKARQSRKSILYFDLKFRNDGPPLMFLNSIGARIRSRFAKMPFGDQGFCLSSKDFKGLGGFPSGTLYGEDHLFIWKARQRGYDVRSIGENVYTSARKYKRDGWLNVTLQHQWLTWKQAVPQLWKMVRPHS